MSTHDRPSTFGRARLSFASTADIDEFAAVLAQFEQGEITPEHLPASLRTRLPQAADVTSGTPSLLSLGLSVEEVEKTMLQEALQKSGGNVSEASRLLKITRNTLRYRMAKHNLLPPQG